MFSALTHLSIAGGSCALVSTLPACAAHACSSTRPALVVPSLKELYYCIYGVVDAAGQRLPFVQYVVSLALVQAIQEQARAQLQVRTAACDNRSSVHARLMLMGASGGHSTCIFETENPDSCHMAALLHHGG